MDKNPWFRALIVILVFIAALFLLAQIFSLLGQFSSILMILFLGWLLAFVLHPIVNWLCGRRLPRLASVAIVYVCLLVLIVVSLFLTIPPIVDQLIRLGERIPSYLQQAGNWLGDLQNALLERGIDIDLRGMLLNQDLGQRIQEFGTLLVTNSINLVTGAANVILTSIMVLVVSFYFVLDGRRITGAILDAVPDDWYDEAAYLIDAVGLKFGGFLRGQLIQAVIYAAGTSVIMSIAGLDYVLVVSLVAGVLMFIPFFGAILGILPPALVAALSGSFPRFLIVVIAVLVLQQVIMNVVAPKVMADAVGMHPILVLLAILLGIQLAGPVGAVFGVPVAAVVNAMGLLFYNRSERVQRHRSVRLGLARSCGPPGHADSGDSFDDAAGEPPARGMAAASRIWLFGLWSRATSRFRKG